MSREKDRRVILHEPEEAVHSYLDALLREVDESPAEEAVKTATVVDLRPSVEALRDATAEIAQPADIVQEEIQQVAAEEQASEVPHEVAVPEWAEQPFQTLFFKVRGMTLGIPLRELNSITEWNQEVTSMPGQPDWYMGIILHRDQRVVVVDTARLIMPERLGPASEERKQGSHVLLIGDGRFGLACDSLLSPKMLEKESVRWRRGEGLQPWMAGTVIDKLSILLDVEALLKMLGHE